MANPDPAENEIDRTCRIDTGKQVRPDDRTEVLKQMPDPCDRTIVMDPDPDTAAPAPGDDHKTGTEKSDFFSSLFRQFNQSAVQTETIVHNNSPSLNWDTGPELFHSELEGKYLIRTRLGKGGQGTVNMATDLPLGRPVAVKTLHKELLSDPQSRAMFHQEAMITAQLDHPSVIPIYALCSSKDGGCHIVMKVVNGGSLTELIEETQEGFETKRLNARTEIKALRSRLEIFLSVCNAMEYVHSRHVIHRDLKPDNIMTGLFHETYIMDWGLASPYVEIDDKIPDPPDPNITVSGTPRYLAPEALRKQKLDQRSDIFALGLILFELVTLNHAFEGKDSDDVMRNIMLGKMEPVAHRYGVHIDSDLKAIIRKASAVRREKRYHTVRKFADDIRRYLDDLEVSARPDNFIRRIIRVSVRHKVLLFTTLLSALLLLVLAVATVFYREWQNETVQRNRDAVMNSISANCIDKAARFNNRIIRIESELEDLAADTAELITEQEEKKTAVPENGGTAEKMKNLLIARPGGISPSEEQRLRTVFLPIHRSMRTMLIQANQRAWGMQIDNTLHDTSELPCREIYITFANGTRMHYTTIEGADFDGRERPWYKAAVLKPDRSIWNPPYADVKDKTLLFTLSKAIVHPKTGKILGVICADISLAHISKEIRPEGRERSYIADRILADEDGHILLSLDPALRPVVKPDDTIDFPTVRRQDIGTIFRSKSGFGYVIISIDGEDFICIRAFIDGPRWYYVEKIRLNAVFEEAERKDR